MKKLNETHLIFKRISFQRISLRFNKISKFLRILISKKFNKKHIFRLSEKKRIADHNLVENDFKKSRSPKKCQNQLITFINIIVKFQIIQTVFIIQAKTFSSPSSSTELNMMICHSSPFMITYIASSSY